MKFGTREIVLLALLVAIPVGAWAVVLRPNSSRNADMLKEIEAKQTRLHELDYATCSIGSIKDEIANLTKAMDYFQSKLPNEKEIDKVLKEVSLLAERNKLTTKSIRQPQKSNTDSQYTSDNENQAEQPIDMQLEGDFMGFYTFLQAMENQSRIIRVSKLTLKKVDKGPEGAMTATIAMSIFFERTNSDAAKTKTKSVVKG